MTADFFQAQIERLRGVYSPSSLSIERTQVFWNRFKHVPNHVFENAISHLIGEFTTQALPGVSRFEEALSKARGSGSSPCGEGGGSFKELPTNFRCEPCRDFGYGWIGDTVTRCVCAEGRKVSDAAIAKHQRDYNKGKEMMLAGKGIFARIGVEPGVTA